VLIYIRRDSVEVTVKWLPSGLQDSGSKPVNINFFFFSVFLIISEGRWVKCFWKFPRGRRVKPPS
jgi:hypothetical protein